MSKQHEQALLFLAKARDDEALLEEVRDSPRVPDGIFGFHAQQAAEKLLKAWLSDLGVSFPRTHNLRFLMDLLRDAGRSLPTVLADLDGLTPFATLFRYENLPTATALDRGEVARRIRTFREHVEQQIEAPPGQPTR